MPNWDKIEKLKKKPLFFWDYIILITAILLVALIVTLVFWNKGSSVQISCDGKTQTYSLSVDRVIKLDKLNVVIENGYVYVTDSKCPDKICEHSPHIRSVNQTIVCLPNNIIIKIVGKDNGGIITGSVKSSLVLGERL